MHINLPKRSTVLGMTLVELVFAIGVGAIVSLAVIGFSIYTARSFAGMMNYVELENQSRGAVDGMVKEMRQVNCLSALTSNSVTFTDYDLQPLVYSYSPTDRTLTRTKAGQTTTLLTGCDMLYFSIFQRNTTNGTYDQYPTTLYASNTKVVQVTWICSRKVTGTPLNSESVQTAKVVLRNQQ